MWYSIVKQSKSRLRQVAICLQTPAAFLSNEIRLVALGRESGRIGKTEGNGEHHRQVKQIGSDICST
jgi:hypothetical protein